VSGPAVASPRRRPHRAGRLDLVVAAAVLVLWPAPARAWGPAAHIDFATESLRYLSLAVPLLRRLLLAHPDAYLYGNFLADNVVGKNRAPEPLHAHSWPVGRRLLDAAADPVERAFAAGYIAHLWADQVAHREFVPAKLIESFAGRGLRHIYWELRFDSRVLQARPDTAETWRRIVRERPAGLERFLAAHLHPALLSHRASHGIFSGTMAMQRRPAWMQAAERVDHRSPFPLPGDEFRWYRERSVDAILAFLSDPAARRTPPPDAVGAPVLAEALRIRRALRLTRLRRSLPPGAWLQLGPALRDAVARGRPLADAVRDTIGWDP